MLINVCAGSLGFPAMWESYFPSTPDNQEYTVFFFSKEKENNSLI
jgi:hypothetical protein